MSESKIADDDMGVSENTPQFCFACRRDKKLVSSNMDGPVLDYYHPVSDQ